MDQEKQGAAENAPPSLEDRLTQLENKFFHMQQSNAQLLENYGNLADYCKSLQSQITLMNKYKNLAIGCKVDHVKKGHFIITHEYTNFTFSILPNNFVDCLTSETKIFNKHNKIVSKKKAFFELRWDKPITFNLIRVALVQDTWISSTHKFEFYISNDDGNDHLELIAKSSNSLCDFQEEIVGSVITKYLKVVLSSGSKVVGFNLFNQ